MQIRCPHCHDRFESHDDDLSDVVSCSSCGNSFRLVDPRVNDTQPLEDQFIGQFRLLRPLGAGAFGEVWLAKDEVLQRQVALKISRRGEQTSEEQARFLREAKSAAGLHHSNIVSVYEVGNCETGIYIVTEYVEGCDLNAYLQSRTPSLQESVTICLTIADALSHAHQNNIVHRDLKPSNVLIDHDGVPFVADFGLARNLHNDVTVTIDGKLIGTPTYMPPEQAAGQGHAADARSDIYSLGVLLYRLLTGELPFRGSLETLLVQIARAQPPSLRSINRRVPVDLEVICLKCLEKDPRMRYQSCEALADDLQRFLAGQPISARPVGTLGRVWRWYQRNPDSARLTAGAAAVIFGAVLCLWDLTGIALFAAGAFGEHVRWQGIAELLGLAMLFFLPVLTLGVLSLNGRRWAVICNTCLFLVSLFVITTAMADKNPLVQNLATFTAAKSTLYARLQLLSLLMWLCVIGSVLHLLAINQPRMGRK